MQTNTQRVKNCCWSLALFAAFLGASGSARAQNEKPATPHGSCAIVQRMGLYDQITGRVLGAHLWGSKEYQFVEGTLPKGAVFHGRLSDHDIRKIIQHGGRIVYLQPRVKGEDLKTLRDDLEFARSQCQAESSKP